MWEEGRVMDWRDGGGGRVGVMQREDGDEDKYVDRKRWDGKS